MKNLLIVSLCLIFTTCAACQGGGKSKDVAHTLNVNMEEEMKKEKVLRHVVLFKFKDSSSVESVEKLNRSFIELAEVIPVIKDFEWGINDSPEDFHQGFTHCYLVTFASEKDRDEVYTPHPQHQAFVQSLQPYLEKVFVVDYWTNPE